MKIESLETENINSNRIFYYLLIPFCYAILSLLNYNSFSLVYSATVIFAPLMEVFFKPIQIQDHLQLKKRWLANYGISFLSYPVITLFIVFLTNYINDNPQRGILAYFEPMPIILEALLAILVIDFLGYIYHYVEHNSFLWRFHQVHHNDSMYDSSLNYKIHPVESVFFSIIILSISTFIIGFSFISIAAAILLRVIFTIAIHINVNISDSIDRVLRLIFITPKMHFIHHSQRLSQTNSNYGAIFSFWDNLFSTHNFNSEDGYDKINIGLDYEDQKTFTLFQLVIMPFKKKQKYHFPKN